MTPRRKWLAVVAAVVLTSLALSPAIASAQAGYPAAPAIASELLRQAGIKGIGPYVSQVARMMGPRASFGGVEKSDIANYRQAVAAFVAGLLGNGGGFSGAGTEKVQVLVGFTSTPGNADENLIRGAGGTVKHRYHLIPAIAAELPAAAIEALQKNPRVTVIEPDLEIQAVGYPEELADTWGVARIGAGVAHEAGYLGEGAKVAVIDSGIDYNHAELTGIYKGGYDFVNKDADPMDDNGHGTHVAGTIAASRNGTGVVGASPEVELYALKVLGANGSGSYSDVIAALQWAVDHDIQVTNNSYGGSGDPGTLVKRAFDSAYSGGVLHVAAAGNSGKVNGRGDNVIYPARYDSVLAVSATTQNDTRASWSSTGPAVELAAPGVSIRSTLLGGGYGLMSGTSMASPHVAGVAALVWAETPTLSNTAVRTILRESAEDLGLSADHQGYGLVDAVAALDVTPPAPTYYTLTVPVVGEGSVTKDPNQTTYLKGTTVELTAEAAEGWEFSHWTGALSGDANPATVTMDADKTVTAVFVEEEEPPLPGELSVEVTTDKGEYPQNSWVSITVKVTDDAGPVPGASVAVTVTDPGDKTTAYSAVTGSDGQAVFRHRIMPKAAKGTYEISVVANKDGAEATGTAEFVVK